MAYAAGTTVTVGKTQGEIHGMLAGRGVQRIATMCEPDSYSFVFDHEGVAYRITLPLPDPNDVKFTEYRSRGTLYARTASAARVLYEKELNRVWRALGLVVKGKIVAVEEGISTMEREFIGNAVLPGGMTVAETYADKLRELRASGQLPALTAPGGR